MGDGGDSSSTHTPPHPPPPHLMGETGAARRPNPATPNASSAAQQRPPPPPATGKRRWLVGEPGAREVRRRLDESPDVLAEVQRISAEQGLAVPPHPRGAQGRSSQGPAGGTASQSGEAAGHAARLLAAMGADPGAIYEALARRVAAKLSDKPQLTSLSQSNPDALISLIAWLMPHAAASRHHLGCLLSAASALLQQRDFPISRLPEATRELLGTTSALQIPQRTARLKIWEGCEGRFAADLKQLATEATASPALAYGRQTEYLMQYAARLGGGGRRSG